MGSFRDATQDNRLTASWSIPLSVVILIPGSGYHGGGENSLPLCFFTVKAKREDIRIRAGDSFYWLAFQPPGIERIAAATYFTYALPLAKTMEVEGSIFIGIPLASFTVY